MFQTSVIEKIKTHSLRSITFFFRKTGVYKIKWKNVVDPDRSQMTIYRKMGNDASLFILTDFYNYTYQQELYLGVY